MSAANQGGPAARPHATAKHTPGPWKAEYDGEDGHWRVRAVSEPEWCIAEAAMYAEPDQTGEDNAKLIAAAPALADALADYVSDADISLESLERVAEEFRLDTGHLAPGKDEAAAVNSGVTHEERQHAWNIWVGKRLRDRLERARVALRAAGRLP